MQQLAVIQNGKVFATHDGNQQITFSQYPSAEKILLMKDGERVKVRDDEPALDRVAIYQTNIPSVNTERQRLQNTIDAIGTHGILTLDNKGEAILTHNLNSKWYAMSVTPLDAAMPDIHVICQKNAVTVKGGANNGKVTYLLTLIQPPKGRENQLLTDRTNNQ